MYVLMDGKNRLGPTIAISDSCPIDVCIYGFSDKPLYDRFIKTCSQNLTPYPLVKGYLSDQIASVDCPGKTSGGTKLVVLDAGGMEQQVVFAATMKAVLKAQLEKAAVVIADWQLVLDAGTSGYTVTRRPDDDSLKSPDHLNDDGGRLLQPPTVETRKTVMGLR